MNGTIVDMHLHTTRGASDSMLTPEQLVEEMRRVGLPGVHLSEHDRLWERYELDRFRRDHPDLFFANGMEVSTDLGHILVLGLQAYVPGIRKARELRRICDEAGAVMIVAHPFRHFFDPVTFRRRGEEPPELTPENMARLPVFELVDAIEVLNGCNTPRENYLALQVARLLGKPGTGGSDAHSQSGIGIYATQFEEALESQEHMLELLRAGRFRPVHGLRDGTVIPFEEGSLDAARA